MLGKGRPPHHLSGSRKKALPAPFLPSARTNASLLLLPGGTKFLPPRLAACATFPCPRLLGCWLSIYPKWQILGGDCQGLCRVQGIHGSTRPLRMNEQQQHRPPTLAESNAGHRLGRARVFLRRGHGHMTDKDLLVCWTDNSGRRRGRRATTPSNTQAAGSSSGRQQQQQAFRFVILLPFGAPKGVYKSR